MGQRDTLGELEQIILLAVARLGEAAYTAAIRQEIDSKAGREISLGTIYVTLTRLESKGYVVSTLGDPTPTRGGRAKRFYDVTDAGRVALQRARQMLTALWDGLELEAEGRNP